MNSVRQTLQTDTCYAVFGVSFSRSRFNAGGGALAFRSAQWERS